MVEWGEYKLGDLFEINSSNKRFDANKVEIKETGNPYVVRTALNNGIRGYIEESEEFLNEWNTISFGQDTATMFYQEKPYFTGDKIKIVKSKDGRFDKKNAQFFILTMTKSFSSFSWGSSSFSVKIIENQKIKLPTKDGNIDFEFMENFIAELEAERLAELEAYLSTTGLRDYTLTSEEERILREFECGEFEWGEFKIEELFEKLNLRFLKSIFDKESDVSKEKTLEFNLPLVNAKEGDNGVMYYGRSQDFEGAEMTIDVVSDGAISTGNVYSQPQKTGVLYNAYLIKPKFSANEKLLHFFTSTIQKSIKLKFGYENKAGWAKVKEEGVQLPIQNNQPDYAIMEILISAIQKLVIKDVVLYTDRKIEATKSIVEKW
jgi:hypothetical protein